MKQSEKFIYHVLPELEDVDLSNEQADKLYKDNIRPVFVRLLRYLQAPESYEFYVSDLHRLHTIDETWSHLALNSLQAYYQSDLYQTGESSQVEATTSYVNQIEFAEILGVSKQHFYQLRKKNTFLSPDIYLSGKPGWLKDKAVDYAEKKRSSSKEPVKYPINEEG